MSLWLMTDFLSEFFFFLLFLVWYGLCLLVLFQPQVVSITKKKWEKKKQLRLVWGKTEELFGSSKCQVFRRIKNVFDVPNLNKLGLYDETLVNGLPSSIKTVISISQIVERKKFLKSDWYPLQKKKKNVKLK